MSKEIVFTKTTGFHLEKYTKLKGITCTRLTGFHHR